jgi:hypothetical protein
MARTRLLLRGAVTIALIAGGASLPAVTAQAATTPRTVILDGATLVSLKAQLTSSPTPEQTSALSALTELADAALTAGPWW